MKTIMRFLATDRPRGYRTKFSMRNMSMSFSGIQLIWLRDMLIIFRIISHQTWIWFKFMVFLNDNIQIEKITIHLNMSQSHFVMLNLRMKCRQLKYTRFIGRVYFFIVILHNKIENGVFSVYQEMVKCLFSGFKCC